jgi:hypothetical protein
MKAVMMTARSKMLWMDVFSLVMFVAAIGTEVSTVKMLINARSAMSWPTIQGLIIGSELVVQHLGIENRYEAKIRYQFEVSKVLFESENVRVRGTSSKYGNDVKPFVTSFPTGSKATVHYNPQNPKESYLSVKPDVGDYVIAVAPLGFALLFGVYLVARIRGDLTATSFAA